MRTIDANFRLLNLKNDSLRRRFDSLKYELQKCDQIVYDLTIRGLKPIEVQGETDCKSNSLPDNFEVPVKKKLKESTN